MTLKYILPAIALTATAVSAEEYQLFTELQAEHLRVSGDNETTWSLNGSYFFDKIQTLGPLDQFKYILNVSNVSASFARAFDENSYGIGGEYFAENGLVFSAGHYRYDDYDVSSVGLGYLISENFIVRAVAVKPEGDDTNFQFLASYNHQLQGNDYLGFTATVDDEFDFFTISSKYFASLGGDRFITIGATIADNDGDTSWGASADYYFSKLTSVGVSYDKEDSYRLDAKHFFNQNWALEAGFASNADNSDLKVYSLSIIGQF
ncbi:putative porin [Arsukibacterium indicum]|uniref:Porin n=1 Tax=Arsukibacterium indicum TaxID=2848612 RepID=A0ABS6MNH3_9GAMM|nr:putative porin [Arsukibacterium indicum]MBV2130368.1 putative porin [Arsukibacterium indicum]